MNAIVVVLCVLLRTIVTGGLIHTCVFMLMKEPVVCLTDVMEGEDISFI